MSHNPFDYVHCPHCDHHLSRLGEVLEYIQQTPPEVMKNGIWQACPQCCGMMVIGRDGTHAIPTRAQFQALTDNDKRLVLSHQKEVMRQKTEMLRSMGAMLKDAAEQRRPAYQGSAAYH